MDGKWYPERSPQSVELQHPSSWPPLHPTQQFVGQNKSFPSRLLPASHTSQWHAAAPTQAHMLLVCSLAQTGWCFWDDGSRLTTWRMWTQQRAWEAMTSEFRWIYRLLEWLTLGKVKSGSPSKQQRIEKQINGSSAGSFPTTLSDAVTGG